MYIEPNTTIKLLRDVPLDETYEHTLYFSSVSNQTNYFSSKAKYTIDKSTYQRVNKGSLKVGYPADRLYDCNYIMFLNSGFGSKWFYGFITAVEYINNDTTLITYVLDDMQTWMFDYQLKQCFVEREHTETDVIGEHTVPEGLELGGYITTNSTTFKPTGLGIMILATENPDDVLNPPRIVEGLPINCYWKYIAVNAPEPWWLDRAIEVYLADILDKFVNAGKVDAIVSMYVAPHLGTYSADVNPPLYPELSSFTAAERTLPIPVKNNKLYCYPYCCLGVETPSQRVELKYELLGGDNHFFAISSCGTPSGSILIYPQEYENQPKNRLFSLSIKGYPLLPWINNYYQNWLAQNQSVINANYTKSGITGLSGVGMAALGLATENPLLAISGVATAISGVANIGSQMAEVIKHSVMPDTLGGSLDSVSTFFALGELDCQTHCRTIRPEYIRIIDNFFTRYGYKINRTKVPNTHSRPHWNYVKTIDCAVTGSVPADALKHICSIYDNGITFWKNPSEVGNYSLDNRP